MRKFKIKTNELKMLADTVTPVSIYLKLRDQFARSILLESSDYHGNENSFSFVCCQPVAHFKVAQGKIEQLFPNGERYIKSIDEKTEIFNKFNQFIESFETEGHNKRSITNGLFGYMSYNTVRYFEDISITEPQSTIPDIYYSIYQYVIAIDHFKNEIYLFEHQFEDESNDIHIQKLVDLIKSKNYPAYSFSRKNEEVSNFNDDQFRAILEKGVKHCHRGDVFQIVLSRRFSSEFKGDDFNVYRALRSINPSPYLFYFDYGNFKLFGSSPEAQIVIKGDEASIYPIAGTFKRTGNDEADRELAKELAQDDKENSEHVMLVDLARNDLSRNAEDVKVETFKEIQFYSHVIHLVSKVTGKLNGNNSALKVVADTFPAGTLSGAPKHKAMQLIDRYENVSREYYGGAIGFIGFNGDFNHAIMIRSFMSHDNKLTYQAGAGVVAKSDPEKELQEVNNKLLALRSAIKMAEKI